MQTEANHQAARTIELRVEKLSQLFDPLDPFPAESRDLSRNAEEFILGWARDLPARAKLRILLHVPTHELDGQMPQGVSSGIASYFTYRAERIASDLRELFRLGRTYLLIGLGVLALCAIGAQVASRSLTEPFGQFVANALVILGWVANWRPIEILLYEWWPLVKRKRLYLRLAEAPVEFATMNPLASVQDSKEVSCDSQSQAGEAGAPMHEGRLAESSPAPTVQQANQVGD